MKAAVTLVRGAQETIARRQVPEHAVLSLATAFIDTACDLATDIASPDERRIQEIAAAVRSCILSQTTAGLRGDASGVTGLLDETTRTICVRQLSTVDRVHLVATIFRAVEDGLRALLSEAVTPQRAREGPSSSRGDTSGTRVKTAAKKAQAVEEPVPPTNTGPRPKVLLDIAVASASEPIGSARMTPDYDDV